MIIMKTLSMILFGKIHAAFEAELNLKTLSVARLVLIASFICLGLLSAVGELRAQAPAVGRHIGVMAASVEEHREEAEAFREGMRKLGYVEGRDISISWWYGQGHPDHASEAAQDLLKRKVDIFVVEGTRVALAVKKVSPSTPIVTALVGDAIESGLVKSLASPGGNVTGLTNQSPDIAAKRLQLL